MPAGNTDGLPGQGADPSSIRDGRAKVDASTYSTHGYEQLTAVLFGWYIPSSKPFNCQIIVMMLVCSGMKPGRTSEAQTCSPIQEQRHFTMYLLK
jgi:hypothetical protein